MQCSWKLATPTQAAHSKLSRSCPLVGLVNVSCDAYRVCRVLPSSQVPQRNDAAAAAAADDENQREPLFLPAVAHVWNWRRWRRGDFRWRCNILQKLVRTRALRRHGVRRADCCKKRASKEQVGMRERVKSIVGQCRSIKWRFLHSALCEFHIR